MVRLKGVLSELWAENQDIDDWGLKRFNDDKNNGFGGNGNAVCDEWGGSGSGDAIELNKWDPNGLEVRGEQLYEGLHELTIADIECFDEPIGQTLCQTFIGFKNIIGIQSKHNINWFAVKAMTHSLEICFL